MIALAYHLARCTGTLPAIQLASKAAGWALLVWAVAALAYG